MAAEANRVLNREISKLRSWAATYKKTRAQLEQHHEEWQRDLERLTEQCRAFAARVLAVPLSELPWGELQNGADAFRRIRAAQRRVAAGEALLSETPVDIEDPMYQRGLRDGLAAARRAPRRQDVDGDVIELFPRPQ